MIQSTHALVHLANFIQHKPPQFSTLYSAVNSIPPEQNPLLVAWKSAQTNQQSEITPLFYDIEDLGELGRMYGHVIPSHAAIHYLSALSRPLLNYLCSSDAGYWALQLQSKGIKTTVVGSGRCFIKKSAESVDALENRHYSKYVLLLVSPSKEELRRALERFSGTQVILVTERSFSSVFASEWTYVDRLGLPNFPPCKYQLWHYRRKRSE